MLHLYVYICCMGYEEYKHRGGRSPRIDPQDPSLLSAEQRARLTKMFEDAIAPQHPPIKDKDGNTIGTVIVFGTGNPDSEDLKGLQDMFMNPENYNIIPFTPIWKEKK